MHTVVRHRARSVAAAALLLKLAILSLVFSVGGDAPAFGQVGDSDRPQNRKSSAKPVAPKPRPTKPPGPARKPATPAAKALIVSPRGPYRTISDAIAD